MIKVDLATAIVLYLLLSLLLVLAAWIWHEFRHPRRPLVIEHKSALRCNICLQPFIGATDTGQERCPRCNSWVKIAPELLAGRNPRP